MVYQSVSDGSVQCGIYNASTNTLIAKTELGSTTNVGIVSMSFSSGVSLLANTLYYLAVTSSANGAMFCGSTSANNFNNSPVPSFWDNNVNLPTTLTPAQTNYLLWIKATT